MVKTVLSTVGFAGWCSLLFGSPFFVYRFGAFTSSELEHWVPMSYAADWRAFAPATLLFVSGAAIAGSHRLPLVSVWLGGLLGVVLGFFLIAWALAGHGGNLEGLIVILAAGVGAIALLMGLLLGSWRRRRTPRARAG